MNKNGEENKTKSDIFTWQHFNAQLKVSISGHDAKTEQFKQKSADMK